MRYLGGKSRTWKQISSFIESVRKPNQAYLEPFVGGAWVLQGIGGKRYASDANEALITMYKALQAGWIPPTNVDETLYATLKARQDVLDPMTAFVGFGVSFGGKWFGGFARSNATRNYASNAKNSLLKQLPLIKDVKFACKSYDELSPKGMVIYCDPPYADTTGYDGVGDFDTLKFWQTVREWSKCNTVIVSEYKAPEDFRCVQEMLTKTDMHTTSGKEKRIEKLFMYQGD